MEKSFGGKQNQKQNRTLRKPESTERKAQVLRAIPEMV
jgi:hypothetical protein